MRSQPFSSGDALETYLQSLYPELYDQSVREGITQSERWESIQRSQPGLDALPDSPQSPEDLLRIIAALPRHVPKRASGRPVVTILAGGKGSRMGCCAADQKALCPIQGKPALLRAVDTYRSFGIEDFVIIVGTGYQAVIECLADRDLPITYLFQDVQLGTGHAGRLGARYLRYAGYQGDVLMVMGDKFIARRALHRIFEDHAEQNADLTLSAAAKAAWPDAGRVVIDDTGHIRAIVEKPDIVLHRLLEDFQRWPGDSIPTNKFISQARSYWNRPDKLEKILGASFWDQLQTLESIPKQDALIPNHNSDLKFNITQSIQLSGKEVEERCDLVNLSLYLFNADALYESMENLRADNAQHELYLTDAAHYLTSNQNEHKYKVIASRMPDDNDIMGFNTPEELQRIEQHIIMENLIDE